MVFLPKQRASCDEIKQKLTNAKLIVQEDMSRDGDEIFLYITAKQEDMEKIAEKMKMRKTLKVSTILNRELPAQF